MAKTKPGRKLVRHNQAVKFPVTVPRQAATNRTSQKKKATWAKKTGK